MSESPSTFGHIIKGQEVLIGEVNERRNPANHDEVVAKYHDGTPEILQQAVASAREAFESWSQIPRSDRGRIIGRAAAILATPEWKEQFATAMIDEIGKTTAGARGEVLKTQKILAHMAGLGTHTPDQVIHPDQPGVDMHTKTKPVGVAALITPFNFPAAVPAWKIVPALIAGCTVVVKPSPAAPMTSALLMELFKEAGVPDGVINLVRGGPQIARLLVEHPDVKSLSFTGSTEAGKNLYRLAANREPPLDPRHMTFEMGGQNALVVLENSDIERAVDAAVNGGFFGEGQRCTATSRLVLEEDIYDEFIGDLRRRIKSLKIGPGRNPENEVGPLISEEALKAVIAAVESSVYNGMNLVCGGERLADGDLVRGHFMQPTLLEGDPEHHGHLALREEIFGPVMGVCSVKNLDEAIAVVNGVRHQHAASIFTNDLRAAHEFAERAEVGMVHINNSTIGGDAQAPFGGLGGATSLGQREMGLRCMDIFLADTTVDINWRGAALGRGAR